MYQHPVKLCLGVALPRSRIRRKAGNSVSCITADKICTFDPIIADDYPMLGFLALPFAMREYPEGMYCLKSTFDGEDKVSCNSWFALIGPHLPPSHRDPASFLYGIGILLCMTCPGRREINKCDYLLQTLLSRDLIVRLDGPTFAILHDREVVREGITNVVEAAACLLAYHFVTNLNYGCPRSFQTFEYVIGLGSPSAKMVRTLISKHSLEVQCE